MKADAVWHLPSPAKINLFLHINGRRPDGYHELQTLFQILDYGDRLSFSRGSEGLLTVSPGLPGVALESNLIYRAAKALLNHAGMDAPPFPVHVEIQKKLPMGGGLGGGSSNAATTLLALNTIWQLGLTVGTLQTIGLQLGADVPVFILGETAWGQGVGEQLTPLPLFTSASPGPSPVYLVIRPDCEVSTAEVFSDERLTRDTPIRKIAPAVEALGNELKNDCEAVVLGKYPAIRKAFKWVSRYGQPHLTGTGSCVFTRIKSLEDGKDILSSLPDNWQGFVSKGLQKSPVSEVLESYTQGQV